MNKLVKSILALVMALGLSLPLAMPVSAQAPSISLLKEADVLSTVEGGTINYTFTVSNTGDTILYDVILTDNGVDVPLSGLTDEDADTLLDDLAISANATGNSAYTVPLGSQALSVDNKAVASGWYEGQEYTSIAVLSIPIERAPSITLTKDGPAAVGYFESIQADYLYAVENTGNASLTITLIDDQTGAIVGPVNDDGNGLLDPQEVWTYNSSYFVECAGVEEMTHINTATAFGTTATGMNTDNVTSSWEVVIFQWLPRTLGYWGNWNNHWTELCISDLVNRVNGQSDYFDGLTPEMVSDLLLSPDQKGKMTIEKAQTLLVKQLLAAWLNVESYEGATDADAATCGSLDAAMRPGANVYLSKVTGAEELFGPAIMTVEEVLGAVELGLSSWTQNEILIAKDVLDEMNNAEGNGYYMFLAAYQIDQENLYTDGTSWGCGSPPGGLGSLFQSFTPTASELNAVELLLRAGGSFPAGGTNVTINIRSGTYDGSVLGTATAFIPGPQAPGAQLTVMLEFTTSISLVPGQVYVIEWVEDPAGDIVLTWMGSDDNPYSGGTAFGCTGISSPDTDYAFATYE